MAGSEEFSHLGRAPLVLSRSDLNQVCRAISVLRGSKRHSILLAERRVLPFDVLPALLLRDEPRGRVRRKGDIKKKRSTPTTPPQRDFPIRRSYEVTP